MLKKILNVAIVALLAASLCAAEQAAFTGRDYLKLSKSRRLDTVTGYIKDAEKSGIVIRNLPVFYCKKLDAFYDKHRDLEKETLPVTLKTLIIMEYDWQEKGVDKDRLAKEWLGEDVYKANKARREKSGI
jgi:hypothetical protein